MTPIAWSKRYPSEELVRKDIDVMIGCVLDVLFATVKRSDVDTIYFKGSASKKWDSIIDYVPMLSDVDVHVLFRSTKRFKRKIGAVKDALAYAGRVENLFLKRDPKFIHIPRVQFQILNDLQKKDHYLPSPTKVVKIIYGHTPYHSFSPDRKLVVSRARHQIDVDVKDVVERLPGRALDKNSNELFRYVNDLGWRVSSCVPNMLIIKGMRYEDVWTNRTTTVKNLRRLKENKMADDYIGFYYHAWQYFLTKKIDHVRKSLICGDKVLRRCVEIEKNNKG